MNALDLAVIHDAKNSLGSLLLSLEKREHFEHEMQIILRTSARLTHLLIWHKEREGEMHLNIDSASPSDLLKELCAEYQPIFPHLIIEYDASQAPVFWFYDAIYIRLALENAVHNACQFARRNVSIKAKLVDGALMFTVVDDGEGFSEDILNNAGKEQSMSTSSRGTGLGMLLSSLIAKQHHNKGHFGQVRLRNDHGAILELILP